MIEIEGEEEQEIPKERKAFYGTRLDFEEEIGFELYKDGKPVTAYGCTIDKVDLHKPEPERRGLWWLGIPYEGERVKEG